MPHSVDLVVAARNSRYTRRNGTYTNKLLCHRLYRVGRKMSPFFLNV